MNPPLTSEEERDLKQAFSKFIGIFSESSGVAKSVIWKTIKEGIEKYGERRPPTFFDELQARVQEEARQTLEKIHQDAKNQRDELAERSRSKA